MSHPMIEPVHSLDDPRLAPYRNLKDRELAREGGRFIAEGEFVVRRLLESDYSVESVLLAEQRAGRILPLVPAGISIYLAPHELIHQIIGYQFHSGIIACGRRKPPAAMERVIPRSGERLTLVVLPETANAENMGALIRISAAFGADALVLGERCCDPFWRQSIRVSMGTIFRLPLVQSQDLAGDLARLRGEWGVQLIASVLDDDAEPLAAVVRPQRLGLLLGNEAQGLAERWIRLCDRSVTIPMQLGTDSLNVAVAAAVFLYHFSRA
jgi:tRNA G18 (ribose-2'-O)-methylase SpoU